MIPADRPDVPDDVPNDMPAERWNAVKWAVEAALELPAGERAAFLDRACAADAAVRREAHRLVRACERAAQSDAFLARAAPEYAAPVVEEMAQRESAQREARPARQAELLAALGPPLAGRYAVDREIGRGGMATVYLARDTKHNRPVAVKVLHADLAHGLGVERFLHEIQVTANLRHPHIVPLHDSGEAGGLLYYVMPYVEGESLRQRLDRQTQLPLEDAVRIAREVAGALDYGHRHNVVHRDLKPANILLDDGHAVVADFGIARAIARSGGESLTETGVTLGTVAYMSPEQATAERQLDGRSDIYSLGCILYEMLAGEPPFTGAAAQTVIAKRLTESAPRLRTMRESVPESVEQAISKALERVPADRFQTAREFAGALQADRPSVPGRGGKANARAAVPTAIAFGHAAAQTQDGATHQRESSGAATARPMTDGTRRIRTRNVALGTTIVAALMMASAAALISRPRAADTLNANVVAVVPFRVAGADPELGYLREGMIDLVAAKLTGEGGPRAVDPRAVLHAWRRAAPTGGGDVPEDAALQLVQKLNAGRLLLGSVVGTPGRLVLNASLLAVPSGRVRAEASATGPSDSLPVLIDQLIAQLLTGEAGEGERLRTLAATSLPVLRAYIDGRTAYRRGRYEESGQHFERALLLDSTFAPATLGLVQSDGGANRDSVARGRELAWAARERLSAGDRAWLVALLGPRYPAQSPMAERLAASEDAVEALPDRPEVWHRYGDELYHWGSLLGIIAPHQRAAHAFRRALELDSTFHAPVHHLVELAVAAGDTAAVRRYTNLVFGRDSTSDAAEYLRWYVAVAMSDSAAVTKVRARFDRLSAASLTRIVGTALLHGIAPDDAERAAAALRSRPDPRSRFRVATGLRVLALNRGRPQAALGVTWHGVALRQQQRLRILEALYWDGDTAAAASAARELSRYADAPQATTPAELREQAADMCAVEQWRLRNGDTRSTRRAIENLRGSTSGRGTAVAYDRNAVCAAALDALLATVERREDARAAVHRADSLMLRVGLLLDPELLLYEGYWVNLLLARLHADHGDIRSALAAVRRRVHHNLFTDFLSTYLLEEGRLAALAGDREGAIRAYRHYVALRSNPEPALAADAADARRELARLEAGRGGVPLLRQPHRGGDR